MSATFVRRVWGGGCVRLSPAEIGRGGSAARVGVEEAERLADLGAAEAIARLEREQDEGNLLKVLSDPYMPGPVAAAMYASNATIAGIQGPVGSGKTTTLLRSRFRRAVQMPRSVIDGRRRYRLLATRKTYRELWSSTIPSYLEVFPRIPNSEWAGGRGDPLRHVIHFEDAHGPVEFEALFMAFGDDPVASLRGVQVTDLWLNEADTIPEELLGVGIGRVGRFPGAAHFHGYPAELASYSQIVCDFNAPDEENWTFKVFHDEKERLKLSAELSRHLPEGAPPLRVAFFNQPGYGEPGAENLTKLETGYYEKQILANRLQGRGDLIDRLIYNKVTHLRAGEPVFQREFNRRIHVSPTTIEAVAGVPLIIGLDQGFKGAAVALQFVEPWQWLVLAELHFPKERLMAAEFGRRLAQLLDQPRFRGLQVEGGYGDMAGEQGASQAAEENATWNLLVAKAAGITVRPQKIGTNRLQPRLEAVRAALEFIQAGQPGLLVDPSCKLLIAGFEARYVWTDAVDASGDKRKVPDKRLTEANVHDALQYGLLSKSKPATGLSPVSLTEGRSALLGLERPGRRPAEPAGGLVTGFDVLNPYGG
jgi:hypothetical protein